MNDKLGVAIKARTFILRKQAAAVAEWLRRLTRNQMGSARAGSNPARCEIFLKQKRYLKFKFLHICVKFCRKEGHDVRCLISIENWTKWLLAFPVVYTAYGDFQFGHHEREIFAAHR